MTSCRRRRRPKSCSSSSRSSGEAGALDPEDVRLLDAHDPLRREDRGRRAGAAGADRGACATTRRSPTSWPAPSRRSTRAFPSTATDLDDIVGVVHVKSVFTVPADDRGHDAGDRDHERGARGARGARPRRAVPRLPGAAHVPRGRRRRARRHRRHHHPRRRRRRARRRDRRRIRRRRCRPTTRRSPGARRGARSCSPVRCIPTRCSNAADSPCPKASSRRSPGSCSISSAICPSPGSASSTTDGASRSSPWSAAGSPPCAGRAKRGRAMTHVNIGALILTRGVVGDERRTSSWSSSRSSPAAPRGSSRCSSSATGAPSRRCAPCATCRAAWARRSWASPSRRSRSATSPSPPSRDLIEPVIEHLGDPPEGAVHAIAFVIAPRHRHVLPSRAGRDGARNLSLAFPERILLSLAPVHRAIMRLFSPVVWMLNGLSNVLLRLFRVQGGQRARHRCTRPPSSRRMLQASHDEGTHRRLRALAARRRARLPGAPRGVGDGAARAWSTRSRGA